MSDTARTQLLETAREMNRCGLNQGTSGNLSLRCESGMLITPSGVPYEHMQTDDLVLVAADGSTEPGVIPSSEWRIHHDVYAARPDAHAILHAHPVHCTALACLNRPIPAFHYMVAMAGGREVPCAPYATFGTQALSDHVVASLTGKKACLMANHGLITLAPSLERALALAVEVEQLARSYLQCLAVGEPVLLSDAEMDRVLDKFRNYGRRD